MAPLVKNRFMTLLSFNLPRRVLLAASAAALLLAACGDPTPETSLASARENLAASDFNAIVIQAKNALRQNPDLPEARYLLGLALVRSGDAAGGEAELLRALELGQPAEAVDPVLAQSLLAQRKYHLVVIRYAGLQPAQPAALASLKTTVAAAHFLLGEIELAQAALLAALNAEPANSLALMLQARTQAARGDVDLAIAGLDTLIGREPANAAAWKLKAELLAAVHGQAAAALAAYRQAASLTPGDIALQTDMLSFLMRHGQGGEAALQIGKLKTLAPNNARVQYLETLLAYDKRDFKLAQTLAQQLLLLAPADPANLLLAGDIALALDAPAQAQSHLELALKGAPQSVLARRLLATAYTRTKQGAKAVATLQPLLGAGTPDAATLALAADAYRQSGDMKKAEALLAQASRLDPANLRARSALALSHLASGGGGDAALAELRAIAASGADTTADLALIGTYSIRQAFEPALQAIDALEKKQPDQPLAANLRGRLLLARNDLAGARVSFERALAIAPDYVAATDGLAAVDLAENKPQAARQRFDALLAKKPNDVPLLLALATLRARSGATKDEVTALVQRAVAANPGDKRPRLALVDFHLRNRDGALALAAARDALAVLPDSPELLDALGRAQQATGDYNQAIASYTKLAALPTQAQSPLPQLRLAGAFQAAKDKPSAAASLRKALAIQPDLLQAQRGLITLAVESKDHAAARDIARKVQQQRPTDVVGYLFEGEIEAGQKQWDKAFDAYQRGLRQVPSPDLARRAHAALGAAGKTAEREQFAVGWLKDHPKDAVFRLYLADISAAQRDFATAEKLYTSVTVLQPNSGVAYNNLAWVSGQLKRSGAIALAEKAVALAPDQPAFMDTLAQLLARDKQYAKALEWEGKAVALQPKNAMLRLNLARMQIRAGNKDQARKELAVLAALGDQFRGQPEVTRLLKSL